MILAKIVADSISPKGNRLTTLEVVMPRYILAELNTHRMLSKNSASSRAIPFNKMVKAVQDNTFIPYAWQKDHKGMQGTEYLTNGIGLAKAIWLSARDSAIKEAKMLNHSQVTKQLANRLLEPFMYHKVLVSGTEFENFFNLRCPQYRYISDIKGQKTLMKSKKDWINKSLKEEPNKYNELLRRINQDGEVLTWLSINEGQADIHMMFLAEAIYDAINESVPVNLKAGEWHIPYGNDMEIGTIIRLAISKGLVETKENLSDYNDADYEIFDNICHKISIARCARLSYQTLGDNPVIDYEADLKLYEVLSKSGHWSPFEHVARTMTKEEYYSYYKGKILYRNDKESVLSNTINHGWCRNFQGFIQFRELLD